MAVKRPQHRPPNDMLCPMLPIVDGCTHGKCRFCDIFTNVPFVLLPEEEIIADIEEIAKTATSITRRIYLTGGNPFALSADRLIHVFDLVEERIPTVKGYGGFCRIMDIKHKSDEDLRLLAARGVDEICIGAESGYDPALEFMVKGHTANDIIEQGQRLHAAGIKFTFFYLTGLAGAGLGQENAKASARVFSAAGPNRILVVCLTPTKTWPLAADIAAGRWAPPGEKEMALEIRTFIENLDCETDVICSHDTDIIKFEGMVPLNQKKMVELMDHQIPKMNEKSARKIREMIHRATFEPGEGA